MDWITAKEAVSLSGYDIAWVWGLIRRQEIDYVSRHVHPDLFMQYPKHAYLVSKSSLLAHMKKTKRGPQKQNKQRATDSLTLTLS